MTQTLAPQLGDWDLAPFYPERLDQEYQRDRQAFRARIAQLKGDLEQSPILSLLQDWEKLVSQAEHLGTYLLCLRSADGRDQQVAGELASFHSDGAQLRQLEVGLMQRLKALSSEQVQALPQDLHFYVERARQRANWQMPPALENLAAELDVDGLSAWGRLYDQISGRLSFSYRDAQGEQKQVPMSMKVSLLEDADAKVRRSVLEGSNAAWEGVEDVCAACLNAIAGTRLTLYKERGIPHFLEPALFDAAITRQTLDSLMGSMAESYEVPRQYLRLKARILGLPQLGFQDLSAPLPDLDNASIPWEKAGHMLVEKTRAAYPDFANFVERSLQAKWVDYTPREGKRPGGYCTGSSQLRQSRIFMTYHGAFGDLMTLAHEFGHAYHTEVMRDERVLNLSYPMTLAETASTFAENLLIDGLLQDPDLSERQRLKLLDTRLEAASAFLLNIPSRFLFEKRFYEERSQGEVSSQRLRQLMCEAQAECYGDCLASEQLDPFFWCSKLHFYITELSFYNFPYSFGYLFSAGVYSMARQRGADFLKVYEQLLQATGRMSTEQVAQEFLGVDLSQPEFWRQSLALVEADLRQFQELATRVYGLAQEPRG
jgi:oligoendopeptidase F